MLGFGPDGLRFPVSGGACSNDLSDPGINQCWTEERPGNPGAPVCAIDASSNDARDHDGHGGDFRGTLFSGNRSDQRVDVRPLPGRDCWNAGCAWGSSAGWVARNLEAIYLDSPEDPSGMRRPCTMVWRQHRTKARAFPPLRSSWRCGSLAPS